MVIGSGRSCGNRGWLAGLTCCGFAFRILNVRTVYLCRRLYVSVYWYFYFNTSKYAPLVGEVISHT